MLSSFSQWSPSPSRNHPRTGAAIPMSQAIEEVWCGDIERICYELCFESVSGVYDIENPRVAQFIDAVDAREDEFMAIESEERSQRKSGIAAFVSCAGTLLAGGGAYALITAADHEPVSKTVLAVGGAIVAGVACGGSLFSYGDARTESEIHEAEFERQGLIAEQAWEYLRDFGEEVEFDATP